MQKQMLTYITAYIMDHGYSPSLKEIAEAMHISTSTARYNLKLLFLFGKLETDLPGNFSSRAYRVKGMKVTFSGAKMVTPWGTSLI